MYLCVFTMAVCIVHRISEQVFIPYNHEMNEADIDEFSLRLLHRKGTLLKKMNKNKTN